MGKQGIVDDGILGNVLDLSRLDSGLKSDTVKLLENLQKELIYDLANKELTEIGKADKNRLLKQSTEAIEATYKDVAQVVDTEGVARLAANSTVNILDDAYRGALSVSLPTDTQMGSIVSNVLIEGAPQKAWWAKQAADTTLKFTGAVRQGMVAAETNQQIIKRVRGVMDVSKRNAAALVQTSVATIANDARMKTFEANDDVIKGYKFVATLDSKTSTRCIAYSGATWNVNKNGINGTTLPFRVPPLHFNCRSTINPITKTFRELGMDIDEIEPGTRASDEGQISSKTTFDGFLKRKGTAYQDDMLGPGRADLWRDGKITLNQLVNNSGRVLTLEELNKKVAKKVVKLTQEEKKINRLLETNQLGQDAIDAGGLSSFRVSSIKKAMAKRNKEIKLLREDIVFYSTKPVYTPKTKPTMTALKREFRKSDAGKSINTEINRLVALNQKDFDKIVKTTMPESSAKSILATIGTRDARIVKLTDRKRLTQKTQIRNAIQPPQGGQIRWVAENPYSKRMLKKDGIEEWGAKFNTVEDMFHPEVLQKMPRVNLKRGTPYRAYYSFGKKRIYMGDTDTATLLHEFGHHVEYNAKLTKKAHDFRKKRTVGESLTSMNGTAERGYADKFFNHYCGRKYPNDAFTKLEATELISMGVEQMYVDPLGFFESDPEYFKFVLDVMWGDK